MNKQSASFIWMVLGCFLALITICIGVSLYTSRDTTVTYSLDDPALDAQISLDILNHTSPSTGSNILRFESHKVLAVKTQRIGRSSKITVYLSIAYSEYIYSDQTIKNGYRVSRPIILTYRTTDNGIHTFAGYWKPDEGVSYSSSIERVFPKEVVLDAFDQNLKEQLQADCNAEAAVKMRELGITLLPNS